MSDPWQQHCECGHHWSTHAESIIGRGGKLIPSVPGHGFCRLCRCPQYTYDIRQNEAGEEQPESPGGSRRD